jgi:hypothetical protein
MASTVVKIAVGVGCGILLAFAALALACTGCVALMGKNLAGADRAAETLSGRPPEATVRKAAWNFCVDSLKRQVLMKLPEEWEVPTDFDYESETFRLAPDRYRVQTCYKYGTVEQRYRIRCVVERTTALSFTMTEVDSDVPP